MAAWRSLPTLNRGSAPFCGAWLKRVALMMTPFNALHGRLGGLQPKTFWPNAKSLNQDVTRAASKRYSRGCPATQSALAIPSAKPFR